MQPFFQMVYRYYYHIERLLDICKIWIVKKLNSFLLNFSDMQKLQSALAGKFSGSPSDTLTEQT